MPRWHRLLVAGLAALLMAADVPPGQLLLDRGAQALAAGDLAEARSRYLRALELAPTEAERARAEAGLGRVSLAEGDTDAAARRFESALARNPDCAPALRGTASLAERSGDRERAHDLLRRAIEADPWSEASHAQRFALTGLAPGEPPASEAAARARAAEHPYDPRANLAAGRLRASRGETEAARAHLEQAIWFGDLAPAAARQAYALLVQLDPGWKERRYVPVHVFADETLRARPDWEFRLRLRLLEISAALDGVLATAFAPASVTGFDAHGAGERLENLEAAFRASRPQVPGRGILAVFTERPLRRSGGNLGQATFLGRLLVVRSEPKERGLRTLAHELIHLYGGVHVSAEAPSLMNPAGRDWNLDPANARIVRALRVRTFGPGGREPNVLARIDLEETTNAYLNAIRTNLLLRRLGLEKGQRRRVRELDPHLGDVSSFAAELLWRSERRVEAVRLLEVAGTLYGPRTPRGRATRIRADELRQALKAYYGVD